MNDDIGDRIFNCNSIFEKFLVIDEEYSEVSLEPDNDVGATFYCNPFEGQVWNVILDLRYVDDLIEINIEFAEDMYEDYDTIHIKWKKGE